MIITSKISLARNFKDLFFPEMLDFDSSKIIADEIRQLLKNSKKYKILDISNDEQLEKYYAHKLISNNFRKNVLDKVLITNKDKNIMIMVNAENHVQINAVANNDKMFSLYDEISKVEAKIDEKIPFAFSEKFGYLTSSLNTLGTGMTPSYVVHIPMLELSTKLGRIKAALNKLGFDVKPAFINGDSSQGGFYEISAKTTLGMTEREVISNLKMMTLEMIDKENIMRNEIYKKESLKIADEVNRAYGILTNAKIVTYKEAEVLMSYIKLGASMNLFDIERQEVFEAIDLYELMTQTTDEVLRLECKSKDKLQVDALRADKYKEVLKEV